MNLGLLRFAFAIGCPPLAFVSFAFGNRAGLTTGWREILTLCFLAIGLVVTGKVRRRKNRPTCQSQTRAGEHCRRSALEGEIYCFQHLRSWRSKLRAIPRNRNFTFYLNVGSNVVTVVSIATTIWFGQHTTIPKPPMAPSSLTVTVG